MAKTIFRIAGIWGFLILTPLLFLRDFISTSTPPAITHPEYFYGFLAVSLLFQALFLLIATDPPRYRPIMVIAVLEKFSYGIVIYWLTATHQSPANLAIFATIDLLLGILFVLAYLKTPRQA
ncbi:MAG TPA: hypothetical protein VL495_00870 [Edaphobacter sp.]|jgi:hypothetical protein|nr:hypothetical protein [Edaphobacter sp.]